MARRIRVSVGRQRVTGVTGPHDANYTRAINAQMNQIRKNLEKVIESINEASVPALLYALEPIYKESQALVPVDTGRLKRSGFLHAEESTKGAVAAIGYAKGGSPWYAALVHERLDFRHKAPTQAKYLSEAVNRHIQEILPRYTEYVKGSTGLSD